MSSYVFGPVPSRRLGRSLGVDLVPFKTCSYDCIYCQLGRTTRKTVQRKEWVPLDEVISQVRDRLSAKPDYITLSGSGEPTLYSRLNELIGALKETKQAPVAVLTNGSLLWDKEVQDGLLSADLVIPSLDAGEASLFRYINRPHETISFEKMVEGLVEFRSRFSGAYWLEVFLIGGITAIQAEVDKMGELIALIQPDRVQINTVTRPPAEDWVMPVSRDDMERFAASLGRKAEVIADFSSVYCEVEFTAMREDVLGLLMRRPCTVDEIAASLNMHINEAVKYVNELLEREAIVADTRDFRTYYKVF